MHKIVAQNVEEYIRPNGQLRNYFKMLQDNDKKLFLVTNSPYHFVWVTNSLFKYCSRDSFVGSVYIYSNDNTIQVNNLL